jgi:serine/threonine-protein kinase
LAVQQLTTGLSSRNQELSDCIQKGLLIDLKPFGVTRIALDINPTFAITTKWGYILADCHQRLVMLDQEGHTVGKFELPGTSTARDNSQITAIAAFAEYGLLIATWSNECGFLYTIDLRSSVTTHVPHQNPAAILNSKSVGAPILATGY